MFSPEVFRTRVGLSATPTSLFMTVHPLQGGLMHCAALFQQVGRVSWSHRGDTLLKRTHLEDSS